LDSLIQIIEKNNLLPQDIQKVKATAMPTVRWRMAQENKLRTPDDFYFNARYVLACAAYRINRAYWHDADTREDPKLREFMEKVEVVYDEREFASACLENPAARKMGAEVLAKGKTFTEKINFLKWHYGVPQEFRVTDEEITKKFRDFASRVLPSDKVNKLAETVLNLEKLKDVAELMEMVAP
jgi:2-methylcitrate dehydratase PrpD